MRNLKRVLSLGLATVMLLGMMVLGTSAADKTFADLTDSDQIVNKEAVSVLVDLGIVEGTDTGAYQPTLTVNRATMAKFVYCLLNGVDDKGALFADMDLGFSDIDTPSASWAKGYINYCASMGIISGDGNGHFYPDVEVSTVQAAKMLLVALGYNADASKYQNDANWAINVMRDAQKSGIVARNMSANAGLSRDNTALLVFNTLSAKTVTPEYAFTVNGDRYVSKYSNNETTLGYDSYGLVKVTAKVDGINADGTAKFAAGTFKYGDKTASGVGVTGAKIPADASMVGSTVAFYVKGTVDAASGNVTATETISSSLMPNVTNVLAVSTDGTSLTNLTTRGNTKFVAELNVNGTTTTEYAIEYYLNGVTVGAETNSGDLTAASFAVPTNVAAAIGKKGASVELVDSDGDGDIDIVRVTDKIVATVSADPTTRVYQGKDQVRIPGVRSAWTDIENVVGYEDLVKGDVVLYYTTSGVMYIEKASTVEGVVTGIRNGNPLIDGEYMEKSGLDNAVLGWNGTDFSNSWTFYLDNAGYIVAAKTESSSASETEYAVVLRTSWVSGSGNLNESGSSGYAQAELLKTDGTREIVTVAAVGPASGSTTNINSSSTKDSRLTPLEGKIISFTSSNDRYTLRQTSASAADSVSVTMGAAQLQYSSTKVTVNANTIFLVRSGSNSNNYSYTAYVGNTEVPSFTGASAQILMNGNIANVVYLTGGTAAATVGNEYVYIPGNEGGGIDYTGVPSSNGRGIAYYEVEAIVDGQLTTLRVKANSGNTVDTNGDGSANTALAAKTLYSVATKEADTDAVTLFSSVNATGTGVTLSGATIATGSFAYATTSDTIIYRISTEGAVDELAWDASFTDETDNVVIAQTSNNGQVADIVYIIERVETGKGLTSVEYTVNNGAVQTISSFTSNNATISDVAAGDVIRITKVNVASGAAYTVTLNGTATTEVTVAGSNATEAKQTLTITVTPEDQGDPDVYTIDIPKIADTVNTLASVRYNGETRSISDTLANITLGSTTGTATVTVKATDSAATVTVSSAATATATVSTVSSSGVFTITGVASGNVNITVTVTPAASGGTAKTYTIPVTVPAAAG